MATATGPGPILGRRRLLAGLAASSFAACSPVSQPTLATRSPTDPDPLARFRLFADAGPTGWSRHLPPVATRRGPRVLALSGGGEDGAFGAGGLVGWSATGQRPAFDIVTGVSTGALLAPFAFLGPDRDDVLRLLFTQHDASDIMKMQPVQALFSDALYDTTPLAQLITKFTPPTVLDAVAARHAAGARLFVVTSELDTARASIWNMGEIAGAGQYPLFRAIMRASSALPGLFPPVRLDYVSGSTRQSETHIDGGVHMQVLALPDAAFTGPSHDRAGGEMYVLINNTLDPAPVHVARTAIAISQQALTTSIRASALAEVNAARLVAQANGSDLFVAAVDPAAGIVYDPSDRFSSDYMNALYRHGHRRGSTGTLWTGG